MASYILHPILIFLTNPPNRKSYREFSKSIECCQSITSKLQGAVSLNFVTQYLTMTVMDVITAEKNIILNAYRLCLPSADQYRGS